jgi:hypothetical protein
MPWNGQEYYRQTLPTACSWPPRDAVDAANDLIMAISNSKEALLVPWVWPAARYCRWPCDGHDRIQSAYDNVARSAIYETC